MNITEALNAIQSNIKSQSQVVEVKGDRGERGERGEPGRDGKDALPVKLSIGVVLTGKPQEEAAARVRRTGENEYELDLLIPAGVQGQRGVAGSTVTVKGERGEDGKTPKFTIGKVTSGDEASASLREVEGEYRLDLCLPRGRTGAVGATGEAGPAPTEDTLHRIAREVVFANREELRGPQGGPGRSVDEEMLATVLLRILHSVGLGNETNRKLAEVKAELKKAINTSTSRNLGGLTSLYKRLDEIIG